MMFAASLLEKRNPLQIKLGATPKS
jgi:hypothetical protein